MFNHQNMALIPTFPLKCENPQTQPFDPLPDQTPRWGRTQLQTQPDTFRGGNGAREDGQETANRDQAPTRQSARIQPTPSAAAPSQTLRASSNFFIFVPPITYKISVMGSHDGSLVSASGSEAAFRG